MKERGPNYDAMCGGETISHKTRAESKSLDTISPQPISNAIKDLLIEYKKNADAIGVANPTNTTGSANEIFLDLHSEKISELAHKLHDRKN